MKKFLLLLLTLVLLPLACLADADSWHLTMEEWESWFQQEAPAAQAEWSGTATWSVNAGEALELSGEMDAYGRVMELEAYVDEEYADEEERKALLLRIVELLGEKLGDTFENAEEILQNLGEEEKEKITGQYYLIFADRYSLMFNVDPDTQWTLEDMSALAEAAAGEEAETSLSYQASLEAEDAPVLSTVTLDGSERIAGITIRRRGADEETMQRMIRSLSEQMLEGDALTRAEEFLNACFADAREKFTERLREDHYTLVLQKQKGRMIRFTFTPKGADPHYLVPRGTVQAKVLDAWERSVAESEAAGKAAIEAAKKEAEGAALAAAAEAVAEADALRQQHPEWILVDQGGLLVAFTGGRRIDSATGNELLELLYINQGDTPVEAGVRQFRLQDVELPTLAIGVSLKPYEALKQELLIEQRMLAQGGLNAVPQAASMDIAFRMNRDHGETVTPDPVRLEKAQIPGAETPDALPTAEQAIAPQVLMEQDGLKLTCRGLSPNGKRLDLLLENSGEETRSLWVSEFNVNGWNIYTDKELIAKPGQAAAVMVRLGEDVPGFTGYDRIRMLVSTDRNDLFPCELRAEPPVETPLTGTVVAEQKGVQVRCLKHWQDDRGEYLYVNLAVINHSGIHILRGNILKDAYSSDSGFVLTVNGVTRTLSSGPIYINPLEDGEALVATLTLPRKTLNEEFGVEIAQVKSIGMTVHLLDYYDKSRNIDLPLTIPIND